ncbi:MAG TPA: multiheme c-type cytochrome [Pyrinomonadaceae bacterium]|nr:multiheme c-type cytochrome [Pyrinomonadaceae bacterium]
MERPIFTAIRSKSAALSLCLIFTACFAVALASSSAPQEGSERVRPGDYAADQKCLSCHREQKTFQNTAHFLTSRPATKNSIAGVFHEGENILRTSNPELYYRMEARKNGFYQTAVLGMPPDTTPFSWRFDLVVGSGRKGQSYLYWGEANRLFQLPASYWIDRGVSKWVNSPGFKDGELNSGRPATTRCLECHTSYFDSISESSAGIRYDKTNYVLGISCARCHGPGGEHAALAAAGQLSRAAKSPGRAIINPANMPRARQIEMCALCHGGVGTEKAPAFSYVAGKPLGDYLHLKTPGPEEAIDVHGNQVALLERSRCFQSSAMTCSTCHNVHQPQREAAAFSGNCLTCHKVENCSLFPKRGREIAQNCVDCHMPKVTSGAIVSTSEGRTVQPQVRSHWIKVYSEAGNP